MSYQKLRVWQMAKVLTTEIHNMTLKLPKFEQFEEAQQIRRSAKSVRSNIVEGYGRRFYKQDYIKFIVYALASNDETIDHLDILFETRSLSDEKLYKELRNKLEVLGQKINKFLQAIERDHSRPDASKHPASINQNQEFRI